MADAAKLPAPTDAKPKDPGRRSSCIGKDAPRVDSREKSTGTAQFTQDVQPARHADGSRSARAAVRREGEELRCDSKAKAIKGVKSVVAFETPVRSGVAVLATDFWSAKQGRDALTIEWDESNAFKTQLR